MTVFAAGNGEDEVSLHQHAIIFKKEKTYTHSAYIYLSIYLSIYPSIYLSVYLSLYIIKINKYIGVYIERASPHKPAPTHALSNSPPLWLAVTAAQWLIRYHGALPSTPAMRKPHQHHLPKQRPFHLGCQNQEIWIWSWNLQMIQVTMLELLEIWITYALAHLVVLPNLMISRDFQAFPWLTMHQVMSQLIPCRSQKLVGKPMAKNLLFHRTYTVSEHLQRLSPSPQCPALSKPSFIQIHFCNLSGTWPILIID